MSFSDLLEQVVNRSLCTTCGACELACPSELIEFDGLVPKLRPGVTDAACGSCTDCLQTCPGADPETPRAELELFGRARTAGERWLGIYRAVRGARARQSDVFARSASGGSTTTLLRIAMERLRLDVLLTMGRSTSRAWRSAAVLRTDPDELLRDAQSTYQLAPYLGCLRRALVDKPGRPIGMVGLACHVQGLRKLQRMATEMGRLARECVVFVVEIACSSGTTPKGTETIITDVLGLDLGSVAEVRYRDGPYPGQLRVWTRDGTIHDVPFWKAVRHFAAFKTHRCLACGDWMSGLADLSVSDGDTNIFNSSLGLHSIEKHGRVFVRTELGARVLRWSEEDGALETWPIELYGNNLGLERKRNRRAAFERSMAAIPEGPVPGYVEPGEIVQDAALIATPAERVAANTDATPTASKL